MPHIGENNIKWHIAYGLDLYIGMPGRNLHTRVNGLAVLVSAISAIFQDYYVQEQRDPRKYWFMKLNEAKIKTKLILLRQFYVSAFEINPYLMQYRANYESAMDDLFTDLLFIINQHALSGGYTMTPGSSSIGIIKEGAKGVVKK